MGYKHSQINVTGKAGFNSQMGLHARVRSNYMNEVKNWKPAKHISMLPGAAKQIHINSLIDEYKYGRDPLRRRGTGFNNLNANKRL